MSSDSRGSKDRLSALLALVIGLIGPPVALVPLAHTINPSPWLAIMFVIGGWVLAFVGSLLTEIWQKLKTPWIDAIANTFDQAVRSKISRYSMHYCRYFTYEHRDLDVKGMGTQGVYTLAVEDIFVELCLDPKPPHKVSSDPLRVPAALPTGSHTIWEFLTTPSLRDQGLVLLGTPGSGKTTLLKYLGLSLIQRRRPRSVKRLPQQLPILLFLREHCQTITTKDAYSLADMARDHAQRWQRPMPTGWIEHRLDRGQCLILFDGLDEVADVLQRKQTVAWVERQMVNYHRNRFILTSRPFGYRQNPLAGVGILEVQPFTFQQATMFIMSWYRANEIKSTGHNDPGTRMIADRNAHDLLHRLRETPALFDMAVNPLLLMMIATVHRYRGTLPGARVELYKEICEVFLGKRQEAYGVQQDMRAEQRQLVLQPLSYTMMVQGLPEVSSKYAEQIITTSLQQVSISLSPHDFLDSIQNSSGLLLEREQGTYAFAHKTFQEYLAAVHIKEEGLERILVDQIHNGWWYETIRLYCAKANATPIIEACLRATTTETLTLALECQNEALRVQEATQHRLQAVIDQGIEDADLERRRVTAVALLSRRLRQMYALNERIYIDTSLLTHAEYQLFLDEQRQQGKFYQPDHWTTPQFPTNQGKAPALGMRRSDAQAFCAWLSQRESGIWSYRLPHTRDVSSIDQEIWQGPSKHSGYWIEDEGRFAWSQMRPSFHTPTFVLKILDRDHIFDHALDLDLARDRDRSLNSTLPLPKDRDRDRILLRAQAFAQDYDLALLHARDRALDLTHSLTSARSLALDIYIQLLMLQERRAGRLPAFEGILLVKERQHEI